MENYKELVHELCAVNEIDLSEKKVSNEAHVMAIIKYDDEDGGRATYVARRSWIDGRDDIHYKEFYEQIETILKTLRKDEQKS